MNEDEALSALLDGACDEQERRWIVDRLLKDDELQQRWLRLHEQRALMRGEWLAGAQNIDSHRVLAAVQEALKDDAPHSNIVSIAPAPRHMNPPEVTSGSEESAKEQASESRTRWLKRLPAIGLSAAAGFALVLWLAPNLRVSDSSREGLSVAIEQGDVGNTLDTVSTLAVVDAQTTLREQRARAYMLRHVQQTSMATGPAAMPLVRLAAFEVRE